MKQRPPVGMRVRLTKNVGLPQFIGREGVVIAHHSDGIALQVKLDGDAKGTKPFTCDPADVARVSSRRVSR